MRHLCDSNVFLALAVGQHAHHRRAAAWFAGLAEADTALFCRSTRISFLRLLTQAVAPGFAPLTNNEAWTVLDRLLEDDAAGFSPEPEGLDPVWRRLSEGGAPSPKTWMDAYLAAFAIAGGMRLVSLDHGFRKYESAGLDLLLLDSP